LRSASAYAAYLVASDSIDEALADLHDELGALDPVAGISRVVATSASSLVDAIDGGTAELLVIGEKNQERERAVPHLVRDDDAWFDFTITVRERGPALELLAYDFEIRFPPQMGAPFLRFDLNLPDHPNQTRDLRAHIHPGHDDLSAPAPLMHPLELITLLVDGLRRPPDRAAARTPTAFEIDWYGATHRALAPPR
jgi:hypothetical protein